MMDENCTVGSDIRTLEEGGVSWSGTSESPPSAEEKVADSPRSTRQAVVSSAESSHVTPASGVLGIQKNEISGYRLNMSGMYYAQQVVSSYDHNDVPEVYDVDISLPDLPSPGFSVDDDTITEGKDDDTFEQAVRRGAFMADVASSSLMERGDNTTLTSGSVPPIDNKTAIFDLEPPPPAIQQETKRRKLFLIMVLACLVIAAVAGLVIGLTASKGGSENNSTRSSAGMTGPTPAPQPQQKNESPEVQEQPSLQDSPTENPVAQVQETSAPTPSPSPFMVDNVERPSPSPTAPPTAAESTGTPVTPPSPTMPQENPATKAPISVPTDEPANAPNGEPTTKAPVAQPTTNSPVREPTNGPTKAPIPLPTNSPIRTPTEEATSAPVPAPAPRFTVSTRQELLNAVDAYLADRSTAPPINRWDVSRITDFSELFSGDRNVRARFFNENLNSWDTSNAVSMRRLFYRAESFNGDVSNWSTGKVNDMSEMFRLALSFNGNLNWNTRNVENMSGMFRAASLFNSDSIASFDTSSCLDMNNMFAYASAFNVDIGSWYTGRVTTMNSMFRSALSFNHDLSWDTSRVRDFSHMFMSATSFNGQLNFRTSSATDMRMMFHTAASFEGKGLESFVVSSVTSMESMFFGATSLDGSGIAAWNLQSIESTMAMFAGASYFSQDLCAWRSQLSRSVSTDNMFAGTSCPRKDGPDPHELFTSPFCVACEGSRPADPTSPPVELADGFTGRAFLTTEELYAAVDAYVEDDSGTTYIAAEYGHPIGRWNVSQLEDFSEVFSARRNPRMLNFDADLGGWDVSSAITTESMFEACVSFTDSKKGLANWDVSSVRNMYRMFESSAFAGDVSGWNVRNCEKFGFMFQFAAHFQANLRRWRPMSARDTSWMFRGAKSFSSDLSNWKLFEVENLNKMFSGALSFNSNLCTWENHVPNDAERRNMFAATSCSITEDPQYGGPWCHPC